MGDRGSREGKPELCAHAMQLFRLMLIPNLTAPMLTSHTMRSASIPAAMAPLLAASPATRAGPLLSTRDSSARSPPAALRPGRRKFRRRQTRVGDCHTNEEDRLVIFKPQYHAPSQCKLIYGNM